MCGFHPQRRNNAHSERTFALFKTQRENECCGIRVIKKRCAIVVVAVLRFRAPPVAGTD
jgi:hypothetical protein